MCGLDVIEVALVMVGDFDRSVETLVRRSSFAIDRSRARCGTVGCCHECSVELLARWGPGDGALASRDAEVIAEGLQDRGSPLYLASRSWSERNAAPTARRSPWDGGRWRPPRSSDLGLAGLGNYVLGRGLLDGRRGRRDPLWHALETATRAARSPSGPRRRISTSRSWGQET